MRKEGKTALFAAAALLAALGVFFATTRQDEPVTYLRTELLAIETATGEKHAFTVEVAEKPVDVQVGLMYRTAMDSDAGMIFLMGHPAKEVSFWMKNTLIPLDMLFVDAKGTIRHIHQNAEPKSLRPVPSRFPVVAVIELNGGETAKRGIVAGDRVLFRYFQ